jgi:hypothetical protein
LNPHVRISESGKPVYDQRDDSDAELPLFDNESDVGWRRKAGNHT